MKFTNHLKSDDADCYLYVPGSVTFISAPWNCVYIPITRGRLSCVDVVDVDMLSAAEESKWILYEPVPSLDHISNLTWTIIKDQAETRTYLKKLTFRMAIAV